MIRRIFLLLSAAVALATAAGVLVVSAAYALFALCRDQFQLGAAGAAAAVTLTVAVVLAIVALALALTARKPPTPDNIVDRVTALLKEHPVMGAGAALGAGLMALRNPKLATTILTSFLASRATGKERRR